MKRLFLITGILVLFCACNNTIPKDYVEHTIDLEHNLGQLTISLPPEFDTVYSWTRWQGDPCSVQVLYRFANKKYSLPQEQGTYYNFVADSLYQLTIVQFKYQGECGDTTTKKIDNELLERFVERYMECYLDIDIFLKEIRTIHKRDFIVIGSKYTRYHSEEKYETELSLYTEVNGYSVWLEFVCMAEDCTDFMNRIEKSLHSIKITAPTKNE